MSLLVSCAMLSLQAPLSAAFGPRVGDADQRVAEVLLADRDGLGTQLNALGPDALSALFEVLERRAFDVDGVRYFLTPDQRERVLRAAGRMPRRALQARFEALVDPAASAQAKSIALELVAEGGGATDLRLMLELARSDAGAHERRPLGRQLELELARVLERDTRGYSRLAELIQDAQVMHDGASAEPVVRAMGSGRSQAAVRPLADMLGVRPELDVAILGQLARVSAGGRQVADEDTLGHVRPYLEHDDPHLQVAAALALGRLEDFKSVPKLIEYLEHEHKGLREQALWSLRRISGLGLSKAPARWLSWHRREVEWWEKQSVELFEQLRSPDPAVAVHAVNLVARRRLFRHELASELTRALSHRDPGVLRQCCNALRQLDSPSAVQALIDCLSIPEASVRDAAWETLKEITGRDLPPAPQEWRDAFPG